MSRIELTAPQTVEREQILIDLHRLGPTIAGHCRECQAPLSLGLLHRVVKWKTVETNGYRRNEQDGYLCKKHAALA